MGFNSNFPAIKQTLMIQIKWHKLWPQNHCFIVTCYLQIFSQKSDISCFHSDEDVIVFSWIMMPCGPVGSYLRFWGTYHLHFQC